MTLEELLVGQYQLRLNAGPYQLLYPFRMTIAQPVNWTGLLDRYRSASARNEVGKLNELTLHAYHSMAIDGYSLTLPQTQAFLQNRIQVPGKSQTDCWAVIDYHQALQQILSLASQREPINLITLRF